MDEINGLEEKYAVLAAKIDELDPEHVFITEYPTVHFERRTSSVRKQPHI